jgi:hypothetical protein
MSARLVTTDIDYDPITGIPHQGSIDYLPGTGRATRSGH